MEMREAEILRYVDGEMPEAESLAFKQKLSAQPDLAEAVSEYQLLKELTSELAGEQDQSFASVADAVVRQVGYSRYTYFDLARWLLPKPVFTGGGLAVAVVILLSVLVAGERGSTKHPVMLASAERESETLQSLIPDVEMDVPVGYRAVSLKIPDNISSDGWLQPSSAVDLFVNVAEESEVAEKRSPVVRKAKILSVLSVYAPPDPDTSIRQRVRAVTVLVPERTVQQLLFASEIDLALSVTEPPADSSKLMPALVARRAIRQGEVLSPDDFSVYPLERSRAQRSLLTESDLGTLEGAIAASDIPADTPVGEESVLRWDGAGVSL